MFPKLLSFHDFFLPTYGLLVAAGFLAALWLATQLAKRDNLNSEKVANLGVYAALSGLVGAKLLMVLLDLKFYWRNPAELFTMATLQAGGIFYGGLLLALIVGYFFMRRNRLPVLRTLDAFAPGLALGHAIGRLGCFSAGCCWGKSCHRPWAVTFTDPESHRLVGVPLGVPLHPTQLYEMMALLIVFAILYRTFRRPHQSGSVIALYLVLASLARFLVEFLRAHDQPNPFGGPLSTAQWISLALMALGALLGWRAARRPAA